MKQLYLSLLISLFFTPLLKGQAARIYAQTDRSIYRAGDILWFSVYAQADGEALADSSVFYAEIYTPNEKLLKKKRFLLQAGRGEGDFSWPLFATAGAYRLRIFMDVDSAALFEKTIWLYDPAFVQKLGTEKKAKTTLENLQQEAKIEAQKIESSKMPLAINVDLNLAAKKHKTRQKEVLGIQFKDAEGKPLSADFSVAVHLASLKDWNNPNIIQYFLGENQTEKIEKGAWTVLNGSFYWACPNLPLAKRKLSVFDAETDELLDKIQTDEEGDFSFPLKKARKIRLVGRYHGFKEQRIIDLRPTRPEQKQEVVFRREKWIDSLALAQKKQALKDSLSGDDVGLYLRCLGNGFLPLPGVALIVHQNTELIDTFLTNADGELLLLGLKEGDYYIRTYYPETENVLYSHCLTSILAGEVYQKDFLPHDIALREENLRFASDYPLKRDSIVLPFYFEQDSLPLDFQNLGSRLSFRALLEDKGLTEEYFSLVSSAEPSSLRDVYVEGISVIREKKLEKQPLFKMDQNIRQGRKQEENKLLISINSESFVDLDSSRQFFVADYAAYHQEKHKNEGLVIPRGNLSPTLFWQAALSSDEKGEAEISYYNNEQKGLFLIEIEGFCAGQPFRAVLPYWVN